MQPLLDDASLPDNPEGLGEEIRILEERLQACENSIKTLMAEENAPSGKDNAAAIHESKQRKMMLRYQKDLRQARLNRMLAL